MITKLSVGRVESIDDPAKAGRIKVSLQEMDGQEYPVWINPSLTPGWVAMPEVGDSVTVQIPEGDDAVEFADEVRYLGRVINEHQGIADDFKDNYPKRRGFRSPKGHLLLFDEDDGVTIAAAGSNIGLTIDAITGISTLGGKSATAESLLKGVTYNLAEATLLPLLAAAFTKLSTELLIPGSAAACSAAATGITTFLSGQATYLSTKGKVV